MPNDNLIYSKTLCFELAIQNINDIVYNFILFFFNLWREGMKKRREGRERSGVERENRKEKLSFLGYELPKQNVNSFKN